MRIIRNKLHSIAEKDSFFTDRTLRQNNFILLFSISVFVFIRPLINSVEKNQLIFNILISALIISGITSLKFRKERFIRLSYFGLFTLLLIWINHFVNRLETELTAFIVFIMFLIYITYSMIYYVARTEKINHVLILNAINSYLLMGLIAAFLFILSDVSYKLLFNISNGTINFGYTKTPVLSDYIYYSFITLTTVGYGDATPAVQLTKSIAIFVSLSGQLYLAILVAMLVGKFLSNKTL